MQSNEDAEDFLDSLLVFDRICPFALGNLPVMSRTVFDVGLDMGRLKHGMRLTKENKRSITSRPGSTLYADQSPNESQPLAVMPELHRERSISISQRLNPDGFPPNHQSVVVPSQESPGPAMHRDFPLPPSHKSSSPENGDSSTQRTSVDPDPRSGVADPNQSFDLRPPPPNRGIKLLDTVSDQMFSGDHLNTILRDPAFFLRFTAFLNRYKPHSAPVLVRYLETQKAMKAVEYANAVAYSIKPLPGDAPGHPPCPAASVAPIFEAKAKRAFEQLVNEALPMYITHTLVKTVTEYMVREITGTTMPMMREWVGSLAEVFCLSDPSLPDNPIVYASEEFYRTTQYGRDYAIGRNCRFLQGPKTNRQCVARLSTALKAGQQISETILNYRRDGSPFMNLLMMAPLYDNRGCVRYFLGAQVDVTGLVEDGRGLETFARYLEDKAQYRKRDNDQPQESASKRSLRTLNEFGQMLSLDESAIFQNHSRCSSIHSNDNGPTMSYLPRGAPPRRETGTRHPRKVLGHDETHDEDERNAWAFSSMGPSGKLPGVYQNYLLVRPYPSLRIIFVSPALRIPGLLQSPFLSRIGGPSHVRDGLSDAFETGVAVTAKVVWLPQGRYEDDDMARPAARRIPGSHYLSISNGPGSAGDSGSRTRYISCTPLFGSDDQVGVWMVVMVENEQVTGTLASREAAWRRFGEAPPTPSECDRDDDAWSVPKKGKRTDSAEPGMMYAEFLRAQSKGRAKVGIGGGEGERERDGMTVNGGREREGMLTGGRERLVGMNDGGERDGSMMNGGGERLGTMNSGRERLGTMNSGRERLDTMNGGGERDDIMISGVERDGMMIGGRERDGMMLGGRERDGMMLGGREREGMILGGREREGMMIGGREREGMMIGGRERLGMMNDGGERDVMMNGGRERLGMMDSGGIVRDGMMTGGRERLGMMNGGGERDRMMISEKERDGMMIGIAEGMGEEGKCL